MDNKTRTIIIAGLVGVVAFGLGVLWSGKNDPSGQISLGEPGYVSKGYQAKRIDTWYPKDRQTDCVKGKAPIVSFLNKGRRYIDKSPKEFLNHSGHYVASKGKYNGSIMLPIGYVLPKDAQTASMLRITGCSGDELSVKVGDIQKNPFLYQMVLNKRGQIKLVRGSAKNKYQNKAVVRSIRHLDLGVGKESAQSQNVPKRTKINK